jgi:hypothetical protein
MKKRGGKMKPHSQSNEHEEEVTVLEKQINRLENLLLKSNLQDIAYHFSSKREVIKVNLLAGLARGVGFTVGTAIFLAILFSLLRQFISLPYIGEHIAELLKIIDSYKGFQGSGTR